MAIVIQAPEKPNVKIPTENDIKTLLRYIPLSELHPYDDNTSTKPLMSRQPRPGKINSQKDINEINTTELNFSNGIKVILKPTNFKNDEISFNAYAPGGSSLVSDNDFLSANYADDIVNASGIGTINNIALKKMLAGKIVTVTPYIDFLRQGFRGNCSPNDLETALQLIHLYFTSPRKDSVAFISFKERLKTTLENRLASPESAFNDTITQTMHNYNQRLRPLTLSALNEINFKRAYEIYKERFSSPGDFTFFFVGNFNTDSIKPLLEKYLGGLPNTSKKETYNDLHISYPKGVIKKTVVAGTEAKSNVHLEYTGNFEYNQKNRLVLNALTRLLSIKLRESIREDKGGTYGVSVYATTNHYPSQDYDLTIHFGCDPKNVKILTDVLFQVINKIKKHGVEDQDLLKVKEIFKREYEVSFRENSFWLGALSNYNYDGENSLDILKLPKIVESITATDLQQAARKYLNKNNYAKFVLMPLKQ